MERYELQKPRDLPIDGNEPALQVFLPLLAAMVGKAVAEAIEQEHPVVFGPDDALEVHVAGSLHAECHYLNVSRAKPFGGSPSNTSNFCEPMTAPFL